METPRTLRVIGPQAPFRYKSSTDDFDVFDNPYNCRGMTQSGWRCSRNIAPKHIPALPNFTLKGLVAYYKPEGSHGNCLAAYYCWQHTAQADFIPLKRSSTIREAVEVKAEVAPRRVLAPKSVNTKVKAVHQVKVEEISTESASSDCRATDRRRAPAPISTAAAATIATRASDLTSSPDVLSPRKKLPVWKDTETVDKKPAVKKEQAETPSSPTFGKRASENAELKAVNAHLLAAMQELATQVEGLKAQMATLESKKAAETVVVVKEEMPVDEKREKAESEPQRTLAAGYYQPSDSMTVDSAIAKQPVVTVAVEPVDLESGPPAETKPPGRWEKARDVCCQCM